MLALPTTPTTAPLIAPLVEDDEAYLRANGLMLRNCTPANILDLTAITLPLPALARPAGLMLWARRGHDRRLLGIAESIEAMLAR